MRFTIALIALAAAASCATQNSSYLTTTAIVTNAQNHSALECWEFLDPVSISADAGTKGATTYEFAKAEETIYTVIPPRANGGQHNAPTTQLVIFLSGLIHVTLPFPAYGNTSMDEAYIVGGANGMLLACDTAGSGHITTYPGDQPTVSLQIHFNDGQIPSHRVLYPGPCHYEGSAGQTSGYLLDY